MAGTALENLSGNQGSLAMLLREGLGPHLEEERAQIAFPGSAETQQ